MSLLRGIQESLLQENCDIGPVLLKLRFLASRLGSDLLEEWVRHEMDGYPPGSAVPDYRQMAVSYKGTFSGSFGAVLNSVPIPPYLIAKHAGEKWLKYEMRQSIAAVDDLNRSHKGNGGALRIEAANLILLLQGHVYEDMACNSITGTISSAALAELQFSVRNRVLELTIELEETIPDSAHIVVESQTTVLSARDIDTVTNITNQVIHGNYTAISSSGSDAQFVFDIGKGDVGALAMALTRNGIPKPEADEFAKIVAEEEPQSPEEPFGVQAKEWLTKNVGKLVDGSWQVGLSVGTRLLSEAAMRYYGLK